MQPIRCCDKLEITVWGGMDIMPSVQKEISYANESNGLNKVAKAVSEN